VSSFSAWMFVASKLGAHAFDGSENNTAPQRWAGVS
jgi:hypothetical protein